MKVDSKQGDRCSTNEDKPDINRQIWELKAAGAEEVIFEYEHGDAKVKLQQAEMFERARAGDTIIVGSITLDCRNGQADPIREAFLQMAGVFSRLELAMIRARIKRGMQNAKAKGKKIGRPQLSKADIPTVFFKHYPTYAAGKMNVSELSSPTVYRYWKMLV